ncbi:MAG: HvfC/BufC family peptide modification chaperone [Acidobacteriaceae bacterium]
MSTALLELQRRMANAVMQPLTRTESMRKRRRDGLRTEREASAFIKPNDQFTSFERLEIYNRQYWFRLYTSFEEDFPGLRAVLGRKQFERLMRAYLEACPSTSYTLRDLGAHLPEWLAENEDFTRPRTRLARDVVRLEWAHIEAYDAASYPTLTPEFLAGIGEETRLRLQPCVRLLEISYPVDELLIDVRQGAGSNDTSSNNAMTARKSRSVRRVAELAPAEIWIAVHRQEFMVYYKRLRSEEYRMLKAIRSGAELGCVFESAFEHSALCEADRAALLQQCFHQWAILGWLYDPDGAGGQGPSSGELL